MSGSLVPYQCGEAVVSGEDQMPEPEVRRHILDIEKMPPGRTVLEIKCRRCGEVVEVGFGPKKVHKKNRRQG